MNKVIIITSGIFLGLISFLAYETPYENTNQIPESNLLLVAHRGFGNYAPDNSITSVKIAIEAGMDGVDLDAQMTKDGHLVIFHDPKVDRLTNGTGYLKDYTLDKLRTLDMGVKFSPKFVGDRIATFEEVLKMVDGKIKVIVELKTSSVGSDGSEEIAINLIQKYKAHNWVYLSSFNPFVLRRLKKIDPTIKTMFIFKDQNVDAEKLREIHPTDLKGIPWVLRKESTRRLLRKWCNPDLLSAEITVSDKTIKRLIKKGYPVFLWPPNNEAQLQASLDKKPYGIITDEPTLALTFGKN